jgi:hypothetical protein
LSDHPPPAFSLCNPDHWKVSARFASINWEPGMKMILDARNSASPPIDDRLAERLEGYIESKASGRIRDLHVVCSDDTIILQGKTRTYHAKQLAQEAALDFADARTTLANQIVVC